MARITKPLTDSEIKAAKPKEKDYKLNDGGGLCLVVRKSGTKMWRFDYKFLNKNKSMSFGSYPLISLREARNLRETNKKLLYDGINPIDYKKQVQEEKSKVKITFKIVLDLWLDVVDKNWSSLTNDRNRGLLNKYLLDIEKKEFNSVTRNDLISIFAILVGKNYLETANKLYKLLNRFYKYSVTYNYCEHNLIADIDKKSLIPAQNVKNMPTLTKESDLKQLLIDIKSYKDLFKSDISTVVALMLAPFVALRPYNLRHLEWNEVNFEKKYLDITASKMKTKKDFVLPLSIQAIDIIKTIEHYSKPKSKFVFPSPNSNSKPISDGTLAHALGRLGYKDVQTIHGFRATFSTILHDNIKIHGQHSDIIESCLAHAEKNQIKAAYNRDSKMKYFDEKKELMDWYGVYLNELLVNKPSKRG